MVKDNGAPVSNREQLGMLVRKVGPYLGLAAALIIALIVQTNDRGNAKEQTCQGLLENRILVANLLATTLSPEALVDPEVQRFSVTAQILLFHPIALCVELGVESHIQLVDQNRTPLAPVPVPAGATPIQIPPVEDVDEPIIELDSTTITSVLLEGTTVERGGRTTVPPGTVVIIPPGPAGPPGPPGPAGTPGTTNTTTGTTPPPSPGPVDFVCDLVGFRC